MKWLLDTNALSEQVRRRPDLNVLAWISARPPQQVAVSVVTVAELRHGAMSTDEPRRSALLTWIETEIEPAFATHTLPLTVDILVEWMRLGRRLAERRMPRATPDTLIAATARIHDLIVVTRNTRDFTGTGVTVYNPWTQETQVMDRV